MKASMFQKFEDDNEWERSKLEAIGKMFSGK